MFSAVKYTIPEILKLSVSKLNALSTISENEAHDVIAVCVRGLGQ
jgi:hypothetical protein